jgi:WD40 repeat protein/tetratricopeptide (TPR) repeat protein
MSSERPGADRLKARVFISYSRADIAFADRLEAGLKQRGFAPLIDRTEIYALEDWWKRIEALIVQADTIAFVLSPDAVTSSICQKEVSFAASLNKRLAPVVHRRVADSAVPEALARLNFIFFDDDARFEDSMDRLTEALETDIAWVRKHTEFGEYARRWAVAGRPGPRGLLLRSPVLEDAEQWIASRPEGAPAPTGEVQAFVTESRRAATQRRNILSGSLGAGLFVALMLAGLTYWQRNIAVEQRDKALVTQSRFLADLSRQLAGAGDQVSALLVAMEGLPDTKSAVARPLVPEAQDAVYQSGATLREIAVLSAPGAKIVSYSLSGDGGRVLTLQDDRSVRVWDVKTNKLLAEHGPFDTNMIGAVLSRSGDRIFISREANPVEAIDAMTGARSEMTAFEQAIWSGIVDRTILVVSADDRHAVLSPPAVGDLDPDTGARSSVVPLDGAGTRKGTRFYLSANGSTVVSNTGTIWNGKTGKVVAKIDPGADRYLDGVNLSPDGTKVVWQQYATAFIYDIPTGRRVSVQHPESEKIKGHERAEANIHDTAFTPDGQRLATAAADKTIRIWDVQTGALLEVLEGHREEVQAVSFVADGRQLLTRSEDGTVRLWAFVADNEIRPPQRFEEKIIGAFVQGDAVWLVVMEDDNTVTVWDYTHDVLIASLKGHTGHQDATTSRARLDPQGRLLITSIGDHNARIWDIKSGTEISSVAVNPKAAMIYDVGFSRDGRLAYATADAVYVWEVATGKIVTIIRPQGDDASTIDTQSTSFDFDGTEIAAATQTGTTIWDVNTGQAKRVLTKEKLAILRYSPDGRRIAVVPIDGETANILDAKTGAVIASLVGHSHFINDLEYSNDGRLILTTSEDSTARLWNAETGQLIRSLTDVGGMFRARFSPDGTKILTETGGPASDTPWRGRIWPVFADTAAMMEAAKSEAPRCLTGDQRAAVFLDRDPPAWCIDMEKWPYQTQDWKEWLKFTRAGARPPLPDAADWQSFVAARDHRDVRTEPVVSDNLNGLSIQKMHVGDPIAALAAYELDVDTSKSSQQFGQASNAMQRGDARLQSGDQAGALAAYQESLDILSKLIAAHQRVSWRQCEVLFKVADVKLRSNDHAGALGAYQQCLDLGRGRPEARNQVWQDLIKIAEMKLQAGDKAGALTAYQESVDAARKLEDGESIKVVRREVSLSLIRLGDVKLQVGDQAGALAAYQESYDFLAEMRDDPLYAPDVWLSLTRIGDVKLGAGDQAGALVAYQDSLGVARQLAAGPDPDRYAPDVWFSLFKLGNAKLRGGDRAGALVAYQESLDNARKRAAREAGNAQAQGHVASSLTSLGDLLREQGDLDQAIADYDQAIALDPKDASVFLKRGAAYFKKGDLDRAIADDNEAVRLDPRYALTYFSRAAAYSAKRDFDRAVADYDEAIRLYPKYVPAYYGRARAYIAKYDVNRAIADYGEVIELDPKNSGAYYGRGRAYLYSGALPEAVADLNQANELNPKYAYAALWLDIANKRSGRPSRLAEASEQIDMTKWPAPIVGLYLGRVSPEAALAAADDTDAETKKGKVCEARFYSGELALQKSAKEDAMRLFHLAAADCPKSFVEYEGTIAELKVLGATP